MVILSLPLASTSVVGSFAIVDAMHGRDICSLFALKRPCLHSASPGTYSKPWSRHLKSEDCDSLCWIASKSGTMISARWAGTLQKAPALPAEIHNSFLKPKSHAHIRRSSSLPPHTHTSAHLYHTCTSTLSLLHIRPLFLSFYISFLLTC